MLWRLSAIQRDGCSAIGPCYAMTPCELRDYTLERRLAAASYAMAAVLVCLCCSCGGKVAVDSAVAEAGPSSRILWSFGDGHNWVISSPTQGADGTLYVTVHVTSDPDEIQHTQDALDRGEPLPLVEWSRELVAISPHGSVIERTELVPPAMRLANTLPLTACRPIANIDGTRWACPGSSEYYYENCSKDQWGNCEFDGLRRILPDGTISAPEAFRSDDSVAVSADGTLYYKYGDLTAIARDGPRWTTATAGPMFVAVGADGAVYADYRGSVPGLEPVGTGEAAGAGVAAFDPISGSALRVVIPPLPADDNGYAPMGAAEVTAGPGATVYSFVATGTAAATTVDSSMYTGTDAGLGYGGLVAATPDGLHAYLNIPGNFPWVVGPNGPIVIEPAYAATQDLRHLLLWVGDEPPRVIEGLRSDYVSHLALLQLDLIMLKTERPDIAGEPQLAVVNYEGHVVWRYRGEQLQQDFSPIPGQGMAYAVTASHKLIAIEAPVDGLGAGPWPMLSGDASNTRRARY
jgi:hypothetical protein